MAGISSVSYSIIVNGEASGFIKPSRGIRQGDPLSPYLFLHCSEVFSALIRNLVQTNRLHGVSISRGTPMITYLLLMTVCYFARHPLKSVNPSKKSLACISCLRDRRLIVIRLLSFLARTLLWT